MILKIDNDFVRKKCPLCSLEKIYKVGNVEYSVPTYFSSQEISLDLKPELWKCSKCRSGFIQNAIPEPQATSLYKNGSSNSRWKESKFEDSKCQEIIGFLSKLFYQDAKILDVGCNTGELLDFAKARGCKTFGIEYSADSIPLLKQKGHTVISSLSEHDNYYNAIAAFDLVEHLYNLPEFIDSCYSQLAKDGYLLILTGNILSFSSVLAGSNWWYASFPEHIVFPSKYYFQRNSKFKVRAWIPTYAGVSYENSLIAVLKYLLKNFFKEAYNGLPSLGTDHVLIVLQK